jgi:hypothetical protein
MSTQVNHMPGVFYLAVKSAFCERIMEMRRELAWWDISPECYQWEKQPDRVGLRRHWKKFENSHGGSTAGGEASPYPPQWWVMKVGSHRNTSLVSTGQSLSDIIPANEQLARDTILQKYVTDPYLADGKKFEMRLFVSITSVEPLSVYLYDDFYLRVADTAYDPNLSASLQVGPGRCLSSPFRAAALAGIFLGDPCSCDGNHEEPLPAHSGGRSQPI